MNILGTFLDEWKLNGRGTDSISDQVLNEWRTNMTSIQHKSQSSGHWPLMSFFRSSLQRRLVVMIFCMAVFPILLSSVISNFWFQRTLKKSTDRELKLSNVLIAQRIEAELRLIQETVGLTFRNFDPRNPNSLNPKAAVTDPDSGKNEEDASILENVIKVIQQGQKESADQPTISIRQHLSDLILSKTLYRALDFVDLDGEYIEGYILDPSSPENWVKRPPENAIDFSEDQGFKDFQGLQNSGEWREGNSTRIRTFPMSGGFPGTLISDVDAARDLQGKVVTPIIPVIHIWALNRSFVRGEDFRKMRSRFGEFTLVRVEINAREFFEKILKKNEVSTTTENYEEVFVGLPDGDYFLHPDADCILCSRSDHGGLSWKNDFPELVERLRNSESDVFFDTDHGRVVAAQKVNIDKNDRDREVVLIRSVPIKDVLQAVTNLRRLTVFLVLIMLLIVVPATLWITRGFTRPIRALVAATDKIAEGDLETDIPVRAEDELGQLADSYEKMKARIRNMIQYLKDRQAVAESANKAKSTFLANMSHELRTPLNGILGYAQILKQNPDLTPKQSEGVGVILRSGEHLLSLINDILDLSKVEAGRMELHPVNFSLYDLLDNLSRIIELRARQKKIAFKLIRSESLPDVVHGDDSRLRQILMNLLSNAVKFTDHGEVVMIARMRGDKVHLEVADTGPGIPPEHLEAIFSPFQQVGRVDRMTEGTGLGLAISRKLTQMLGGELKVKSEVGKGSRFYFDIHLPEVTDASLMPQADTTMFWMGTASKDTGKLEAARNAAKDQHLIIGYEGPRLKVMVVDDKTENRNILKELLTPLGFEVFEADDGEEAVRLFNKEKPGLVLMDLRMPRCDGYEATRRIRALDDGKEPVIITVSASAFASNRQDSLDAGATDFIPKPVRRSLLLETIHQHFGIQWVMKPAGTKAPQDDTGTHAEDDGNSQSESARLPHGRICSSCIAYIDQMSDLAKKGNLKAIDTKLNEMVEALPQMSGFESSLRPLVRGFKIKEINQMLQEIREDLLVRADETKTQSSDITSLN